MDTVKVKKDQLLDILRSNREKHHEIVIKAQCVYRAKVIQELDKMLDDAKNGHTLVTQVKLPVPVDMTRDYDDAIEMLEMHQEDTIELDSHEFKQYVKDEWQWKQHFTTSNAGYVR